LTGLPARTSAATFLLNAFLLVDLLSGIKLFSLRVFPEVWQVLQQMPLVWLQLRCWYL
jgi:hypothetical protein